MKKLHSRLMLFLKIWSLIGIFLFVFWMCGHTFAPFVVWEKISHPHTIDLWDDILIHWWPMLVTMSIYFNIFGVNAIMWFYKSLNNGKVRWGGKAGND